MTDAERYAMGIDLVACADRILHGSPGKTRAAERLEVLEDHAKEMQWDAGAMLARAAVLNFRRRGEKGVQWGVIGHCLLGVAKLELDDRKMFPRPPSTRGGRMTLMLRANDLNAEARSRADAARLLYAKACYLLALGTVCRVLDVRMADALGSAQTRTPGGPGPHARRLHGGYEFQSAARPGRARRPDHAPGRGPRLPRCRGSPRRSGVRPSSHRHRATAQGGGMTGKPSIAEIKAMLQARIRDVCVWLAPGGRFEHGRYVALNPTRADRKMGSFIIWTGGNACGAFKDFAAGEADKGDVFDLVQYCLGLQTKSAAYEAALTWLGGAAVFSNPKLIAQARADSTTRADRDAARGKA